MHNSTLDPQLLGIADAVAGCCLCHQFVTRLTFQVCALEASHLFLTGTRDECPERSNMATLAPDSDSDSNYGYDLTAEEEEAVANLVACASSQAAARPVLAPSTLSPGSSATTSPLRADRNAAFAARTIINAPSHGGLDLAGASHDHNFTNDDDEPGVLPAVAKGAKRLAPSSVSWDASLAAFVDMAKPRSIPGPVKADGISYPDCKFFGGPPPVGLFRDDSD